MTELESPIQRRRNEIEKNEQERKNIVDPELVDTLKLKYLERIARALEGIERQLSGEPGRL